MWLKAGERVHLECGNPFLDGLRGTVQSVSEAEGGVAYVQWDDGTEGTYWFSKLGREADNPNYPQPGPWANELPN